MIFDTLAIKEGICMIKRVFGTATALRYFQPVNLDSFIHSVLYLKISNNHANLAVK
jgi:hypothetical protein